VAVKRLGKCEFSTAGPAEPLGSRSIGFDFGHIHFSYSFIYSVTDRLDGFTALKKCAVRTNADIVKAI
jgi:hypothetical protein